MKSASVFLKSSHGYSVQLDHFDIVPKGIAYEASVGDVTQIIALIDIISTLLNLAGEASESFWFYKPLLEKSYRILYGVW